MIVFATAVTASRDIKAQNQAPRRGCEIIEYTKTSTFFLPIDGDTDLELWGGGIVTWLQPLREVLIETTSAFSVTTIDFNDVTSHHLILQRRQQTRVGERFSSY